MPLTIAVSSLRPGPFDPHDPGSVAALCDQRIAALSRGELIDVITACQQYWTGEDLRGRLPFADEGTLRRLAYLARQCCRVRSAPAGRELAT